VTGSLAFELPDGTRAEYHLGRGDKARRVLAALGRLPAQSTPEQRVAACWALTDSERRAVRTIADDLAGRLAAGSAP
jgi:hypothetical protein